MDDKAGNKITWSDDYKIGVASIDNAHQKLFTIVQRMMILNEDEKNNKWLCDEGIKYFKSYAVNHFADEEAYMRSINYPGYINHKRLHDNFRDKTLPKIELQMRFYNYSSSSIRHFLEICYNWLNSHIILIDGAIAGKKGNRGTVASRHLETHKQNNT